MEHLMLGLGELTGLDIVAGAEHPCFEVGRSVRARTLSAAARDIASGILRRLGFDISGDERCRGDAGRSRPVPHATGAPRS